MANDLDDLGFALPEVLIAAALLVLLAAGVSQILAAAIRGGESSRLRAIATIAAAAKMEELRSITLADVQSGLDYVDGAGAAIGSTPPAPPTAVFVRRWAVRSLTTDTSVIALLVELRTRDGASAACLATVRAAR